MQQYLDLLKDVLENGHDKDDRTGTGTRSVFGRQMRFDLRKGFPLVTTKKVHLRSIIHELLWFLRGDTNIGYLKDNGVRIWDEWADENGDLGPIYGKQWREWSDTKIVIGLNSPESKRLRGLGYREVGLLHHNAPHSDQPFGIVYQKEHDQISTVMKQLKEDPDSRRIIVSAWNVGDLADMRLQPCHSFFQFYTRKLTLRERIDWCKVNDPDLWEDYAGDVAVGSERRHEWLSENGCPERALSCMLYARSQDTLLGTPFNIASYALLTMMIAQQLNMAVGEFVWTGGDTHIYNNHIEQVNLQLSREPYPLPTLLIKRKPDTIFDYQYDDFELVGYQSHDPIKAPVAV